MKLVPLSQDDITARWDWLRAGLLQMAAKVGERYRPEDVYLRLRSNTAWAYAIDDAGFVILTNEHDADGLVLFVWIIWAPPGSLRGREDTVYAGLVELARSVKAKRIRMQSPRPGWGRDGFFRNVATVYEHEINAQ